jgi:hypothetical protein
MKIPHGKADVKAGLDEFVEAVRRNRVPHPTQRKFTLQKWRAAFESIVSQSELDKRLFDSGIYFYNELQKARQRHAALKCLGIPPEDHARLLVAAANRAVAIDLVYSRERAAENAKVPTEGTPTVFGPILQAANSGLAARAVELFDAIRHIVPEAVVRRDA